MKRWFLALLVACAACDSASPVDIDPLEAIECLTNGIDVCAETGSLTLEIFVVTVERNP